jgi:nicotine blue oxidoreductase
VSTPAADAVLLAAGAGRRFGGPKALMEVRGTWVLPMLVEALRAGGCARVAVVLPEAIADTVERRGGCGADLVARNADPDAGRTGSIQCGLQALGTPQGPLLVHPCDIPLLAGAVVARLIATWRAHPERDRALIRPVTPGGKGGHPLIVGALRVEELRMYPVDRPLRDLLRDHADRVQDVVIRGDPGPFLDVDTPEQLQLLESLLNR